MSDVRDLGVVLVRFICLVIMCVGACLHGTLYPMTGCVLYLDRLLRWRYSLGVKKQPSQGVLHGDAAEEELGLARLVSSYTLPHQNSQPGRRGWQTARSKVLSRRARDT